MDQPPTRTDADPIEPGSATPNEVRQSPIAARKPYQTPRLVAHGRVPARTLQTSGDADDVPPSDRNLKEAFAPVDPLDVLRRVASLPLETWSYKGERVRHLGPMAQDFAAAFGLGADDRHIHTLDAAGVALAAIQGLHALAAAQTARLAALDRECAALRTEVQTLRAGLPEVEGVA